MTLLMLCREPRLYSCQRLKQAAEQKGISLDILDPNRFLLKLQQGRFECFYHSGESYDKTRPEPVKLADYLGIIPRFGTSSTEMGCRVLNHYEQQGVAVLNNAQSFALARDKWQSLQRLVGAGIAVPDSLVMGELCGISAGIRHFSLPMIAKTLSGSQGVGVMLMEQSSTAQSVLETFKAVGVESLLQKFVAESKGEDLRAFVVGDQVVAAMRRYNTSGEFRANIHKGGSAEAVELSEMEKQLAIQATKAIGLDVAGVDLIRSETETLVLEVNASPGLEMIEKVSQVDIASLMIQQLLQKIPQN